MELGGGVQCAVHRLQQSPASCGTAQVRRLDECLARRLRVEEGALQIDDHQLLDAIAGGVVSRQLAEEVSELP